MAAISGLVGAVSTVTKNFFEINTVSIDNWSFKLYYKWTSTLLIVSSIIVTSKQFFGDPIECDAGHASGMIDKDVLDAYCWMYSTFNVPHAYKGQCAAGEEDSGANVLIYNSYYQWVPLYLILLSVLFYLPRVMWASIEGGLMKFFGKGTRSRVIEDREERLEMLRKYFQQHVTNRYNVYFYGFMFCECLNLAIVVASFFLTDRFLNNRFFDYGIRVLDYYRLPPDEQQVGWVVNPLCRTFPRVAYCDYIRFGMGGGEERINALCILSLNMINDKVFYILWWWILLVTFTGLVSIFQRLIQCCSASLRYNLIHIRLYRYLHQSPKVDQIRDYLQECKLGDWFVLYQLSKNLYRPFFMDLLISLSMETEDNEDNGEAGGDVGDNLLSMMLRPKYRDSIVTVSGL